MARTLFSRRLWIPAAAVALALGCGAPATEEEETPAPTGGAQSPAAQDAGAAPTVDAELTLAGIVFQDDQFFRLVELGMKDAAAKANVKIMTGNSAGRIEKESELVDSYMVAGADAIILSALSREASIPALQRAQEKGIKIVTYNTSVDADIPVSNIESDQVDLGAQTGRAAREYIETKLNGQAKIGMLEFLSQVPEQNAMRVQGFKQGLEGLPGVEIVSEQDAWLAPQAADAVQNILTAHPDVNLIWGANEGGTVGAVTAVKNAGKAGQVAVFGTDMSEQLADFLLAGDNILQAVTGQKPFDIGQQAVEAAIKALKGEPVEKNVALSGVLFSRANLDEVKAYREKLKELAE